VHPQVGAGLSLRARVAGDANRQTAEDVVIDAFDAERAARQVVGRGRGTRIARGSVRIGNGGSGGIGSLGGLALRPLLQRRLAVPVREIRTGVAAGGPRELIGRRVVRRPVEAWIVLEVES